MNLDGFHVTDHRGHVGGHVSPVSMEHAQPMPAKLRNAWKYHESIPEGGMRDRYFYGYDDIEQLTTRYQTDLTGTVHKVDGWDQRESMRRQRVSGWRWRRDNTTKRIEYYLFDLLETDWYYLADKPGNRLSEVHDLVLNARHYLMARNQERM